MPKKKLKKRAKSRDKSRAKSRIFEKEHRLIATRNVEKKKAEGWVQIDKPKESHDREMGVKTNTEDMILMEKRNKPIKDNSNKERREVFIGSVLKRKEEGWREVRNIAPDLVLMEK